MTGFRPPVLKISINATTNNTQYNLHSTALPENVSPTVSVTLPSSMALVDMVEKQILLNGLPILTALIMGLMTIYALCKRYPACFYIIVAICQFAWLVLKTPFLIIHQKMCPRRYRGPPPSNG